MMRAFLAVLLALVPLAAQADITLTNYLSSGQQISRYDTDNNLMDAKAGTILQVGSTFYKYGDSQDCGFQWKVDSPWCGFKIYSSTDLIVWHYVGKMFDSTTTYWQDRCKGVAGVGGGCFGANMVYNAANNNYVFWFNQSVSSSLPAPNAMFVLTCTTPTGGCTKQADPSHLAHADAVDFQIAVDQGTGIAYMAYSGLDGGSTTEHVYVAQLTSDYLDSTGTEVDTGQLNEGIGLFTKGGNWYVTFGGNCGLCTGTYTKYVMASSALGSYGSAVQINANTCAGQPNHVSIIVGGASTSYLFQSGQVFAAGLGNYGLMREFWQPLTFTGSAIDAYSCNATATVLGLTADTPPAQSPTPDQTSLPGNYYNWPNGPPVLGRMQTFVPSNSHLGFARIEMGQNCASSTGGGAGCSQINANVTVNLVTVNGSNNPTSTLATVTFVPAQMPWTERFINVPFNISVTPGSHYGLQVMNSSTTGAATVSFNNADNLYSSGVERYTTDGSTWTTEANTSMMFSTFSSNLAAGGAPMVIHSRPGS